MKRKLIVLQGPSNAGKTTSLHFLYKILMANSDAKLISFKAIGLKLDFIATISIGGHLVGVFNRGDVPKEVEESLQELMGKNCRVIIGAAHTKGKIKDVLASARGTYELKPVSKRKVVGESRQAISNHITAHELAAMVYAAINV